MNKNKLRIIVLLFLFALLFIIGVYGFSGEFHRDLPKETDPILDTTQNDVTIPFVPTIFIPAETANETTIATTQATTAPTTEATTEPETTEAIIADIGLKAAQVAMAQIGKPYQYGSAGPDAFDTSGLLQYCFKECEISIPRSNSALASYGNIVDKEDILPGDAVFFWSSAPGTAEYLGIYIGDGKVIAALNASKPVTQFDMNSTYYTEHFVFARRFY